VDQNPEFKKKFPQGVGDFSPVRPVPMPEFSQELHRTDKTLLSREEIRSIGRLGIFADTINEHPGIIVVDEADLAPPEGSLSTMNPETLIELAGLAIHSPDIVFGYEVNEAPGHGMIETIDDSTISRLGGTIMNFAENAQNN
jgi:hypothetical protein